MKVTKKKWIRVRIYLVGMVFMAALVVVWGRVYQLQILKKKELEAFARAGYEGVVRLPSRRGTIYDREGRELALSVEVRSVFAHPKRVKQKRDAARKLSKALDERPSRILKLLRQKRNFVWIQRKVPPRKAHHIQSLALEGIGITKETRRYYPGKEIAGHLLGFVGEDNQGLEGLEKRYDDLLKGPQYKLVQARDALGRPFSVRKLVPTDRKSHDLVLTIDSAIQYKAQEALQKAVKKTRAKSGNCVVVEPSTGAILAMAVIPAFNPNIFSSFSPREWRNRCITDTFEPGSTMKAFLLAAGLQEHVITPLTLFNCEEGRYAVGGRVIHDTHRYGLLSVWDIVTRSSNIGAVKIGRQLGYDKYYRYLRRFGFGRKTGIDLFGEREGSLRSPGRTRAIEEANSYFGQGMTTTTLQLAMAMAAIANGGKLMQPYVVRRILDDSGRVIRDRKPHMIRKVLSPWTAKKVMRILEDVVSDEGTGPKAAIHGFRVAGKTGTAQKVDPATKRYSSSKYVSTFMGAVPADGPQLVIVVTVNEPKEMRYGGLVAGPVFSEVGGWALNHLHVSPGIKLASATNPDSEKSDRDSVTRRAISKIQNSLKLRAGLLPDFKGLSIREVLKKAEALGIRVAVEGTGLAVEQVPGPGFPLQKVKAVKVAFRPPL